jgi:hypothetical protein
VLSFKGRKKETQPFSLTDWHSLHHLAPLHFSPCDVFSTRTPGGFLTSSLPHGTRLVEHLLLLFLFFTLICPSFIYLISVCNRVLLLPSTGRSFLTSNEEDDQTMTWKFTTEIMIGFQEHKRDRWVESVSYVSMYNLYDYLVYSFK